MGNVFQAMVVFCYIVQILSPARQVSEITPRTLLFRPTCFHWLKRLWGILRQAAGHRKTIEHQRHGRELRFGKQVKEENKMCVRNFTTPPWKPRSHRAKTPKTFTNPTCNCAWPCYYDTHAHSRTREIVLWNISVSSPPSRSHLCLCLSPGPTLLVRAL